MIDELDFGAPGDIKQGVPKSIRVKRVQEWLNLNGIGIKVDRDFGPATEKCVKTFQKKKALPETGVVDNATFDTLVAPMRAALAQIPAAGKTLNQLIVAYARQHVAQHPVEIGGPNRGPWVRLYMDGLDGAAELWCAGFATYPIKQATDTLQVQMPVLRDFGVRNIAGAAKSHNNFIGLPAAADRSKIKPGSLFLERDSKKPPPGEPQNYVHCGIVVSVAAETMTTIEGNSNHDGSSNGFEALVRTRGFNRMDFALA
jgi:hypothetical protein